MTYVIKSVTGEPCFDTLGVIKLYCSTSVPINDRIYAQAQLGHNADSLFLRVLSFETKPSGDARLSVVLSHNNKTLKLSVTADGQAFACCGATDLTAHMTSYITQGEDLQGEYWAAVMLFPLEQLLATFDTTAEQLPLRLSGNILRENPALSSAAPTDETVTFNLM